MKRRRIIVAALLVAVLGGIGWFVFREREPIYEGKPLRVWLEGFVPRSGSRIIFGSNAPTGGGVNVANRTNAGTNTGPRFQTQIAIGTMAGSRAPEFEAAERALIHFGTNAIPTLLGMLRARDSALKLKLIDLTQKQPLIKINPTPATHWNLVAVKGLERLGPDARGAIPGMIEVYDRSLSMDPKTPGVQWAGLVLGIPDVLGGLGPDARSAIPSLLRGAAHTSANVRWIALRALGNIRSEPATVVPVLTNALRDPDAFVKMEALRALTNFTDDAHRAIPGMVELLNEPWSQGVPQVTLLVLRKLHGNPAVVVPALIKSLGDTNNPFKAFDTALTLGAYGADARPAVPAMIESLKWQPNENRRANIRRVIEQIEPGALEKAGVK